MSVLGKSSISDNKDQREKYSRYSVVSENKAEGATYTPKILADFVASKIKELSYDFSDRKILKILDPAIGDGQLIISLLEFFYSCQELSIEVHGFETNSNAIDVAKERIKQGFPKVKINIRQEDFLEFAFNYFQINNQISLFETETLDKYDIIIANPPYVRTQIMGADKAKLLSRRFSLSGRIDLYHAFILASAHALDPKGKMGIIVSNRFMTTRSGEAVRNALINKLNLRQIWDFGDSKLFDAAILPAVIVAEGKNIQKHEQPSFTSIYETKQLTNIKACTLLEALSYTGTVEIDDGRKFLVRHGNLNIDKTAHFIWSIKNKESDAWLKTVNDHTWKTFGDIWKIHVGVKTCADSVFIRTDWHTMNEDIRPELIRPLTTHHIARRYKALDSRENKQILYPHEAVQGKSKPVDLLSYPKSKMYLENHNTILKKRKYLLEAGRKWYELWVPQDPSAWEKTKLVFRDISKESTFWIDKTGSIINGDCYWIVHDGPGEEDLLWLAVAVGNSDFIEQFYDTCFNNKLYAGRRRFITQYVEKFPLPDPKSDISKIIIMNAKNIYNNIKSYNSNQLQDEINCMVYEAFGLTIKKISR